MPFKDTTSLQEAINYEEMTFIDNLIDLNVEYYARHFDIDINDVPDGIFQIVQDLSIEDLMKPDFEDMKSRI